MSERRAGPSPRQPELDDVIVSQTPTPHRNCETRPQRALEELELPRPSGAANCSAFRRPDSILNGPRAHHGSAGFPAGPRCFVDNPRAGGAPIGTAAHPNNIPRPPTPQAVRTAPSAPSQQTRGSFSRADRSAEHADRSADPCASRKRCLRSRRSRLFLPCHRAPSVSSQDALVPPQPTASCGRRWPEPRGSVRRSRVQQP